MPTVQVTKKSFLKTSEDAAPQLYKPGAIIADYEGPMGTNLKEVDAAQQKRIDRARDRRREPALAELPARVERLEDAVGQDAINAAAKKRANEEQAEREKVAAEQKKADEAAAAEKASAKKAKDDAAAKAAADAAKPVASPNIIKPAEAPASTTVDETVRTK